MELIKVGLIGCGNIARLHLKGFMKSGKSELTAVADPKPEKAAKFLKACAEQYGVDTSRVRIYADYREMLEKEPLDAVTVCTPNGVHAEQSIAALEKGLHVLCEKPMSVTLAEADAMVRAEKAADRMLVIGFQPRYNASMQQVKQVIDSGVLGKIYYIQTGGGRRRGIPTPFGTSFIEKKTAGLGALADIGCYSLDMVLHAIGYPKPLTVSGYTSAYFGHRPDYYTVKGYPAEYADKFDVDDFAAAFIRLEGDIVLDFRISWAMHMDSPGDTIFLGTEGGLRVPATECWNGGLTRPMTLYYEKDGVPMQEELPLVEYKGDSFDDKIGAFCDAILLFRDGKKEEARALAEASTAEIYYNQAIIDGISRSAELGREVELAL